MSSEKDFEQFLSVISHDMRAPIRHIRGFKKLLLKDLSQSFSEEQKHFSQNIDNAIDVFEKQLQALLRLYRLKLSPDETLNMDEIISSVVIRKQSEYSLGSSVHFNIDVDKDDFIGSRTAVEEIATELVDNVLLFARREGQPLSVSVSAQRNNNGFSLIVEDNGPGVRDQDAERIFIPLKQLCKPGDVSGVGIGLAVVKRLARLHGGDARFDPDVGSGCRIMVNLCSGFSDATQP